MAFVSTRACIRENKVMPGSANYGASTRLNGDAVMPIYRSNRDFYSRNSLPNAGMDIYAENGYAFYDPQYLYGVEVNVERPQYVEMLLNNAPYGYPNGITDPENVKTQYTNYAKLM